MMRKMKKRTFFLLSAGIALVAQLIPFAGLSSSPKRSVLDTFSLSVAHAEVPNPVPIDPGGSAGCAGSGGGGSASGSCGGGGGSCGGGAGGDAGGSASGGCY